MLYEVITKIFRQVGNTEALFRFGRPFLLYLKWDATSQIHSTRIFRKRFEFYRD